MTPHPHIPTFLLIGAAKAGTSSLHLMLDQHPDLLMLQGERKFFSHDQNYAEGFEAYRALFDRAAAEHGRPLESFAAVGEGSNDYALAELYPHAAERIAAHLPQAKLLYLVRDPIKRIESFYLQLASQGDLGGMDIDTAVRERPAWFARGSDYAAQLDRYLARFPETSVHVAFAEDLRRDPAGVLNACFRFLGLRELDAGEITPESANPSAGKRLDRPAMHRLRALPGYKALKAMLPGSARAAIKRNALQDTVTAKPRLSADTRERVLAGLAEPSRALLRRHGKPETLWDLDAAAPKPQPHQPAHGAHG